MRARALTAAMCAALAVLGAAAGDAAAYPPGQPPPCRQAWVMPLGKTGPGVSRTALGPPRWAYEVGYPAGRFQGRRPRGIMLLIHGGGWYIVGPGPLAGQRESALRWRRRGWLTVNIDHPPCGESLDGVLWFHDLVRARLGRGLPLCASGASSGAHLALMLAARRRDVACVIGEAPFTDLTALRGRVSASGSASGAESAADLALAAFGASRLAALSPIRHVGAIHARVLLAIGRRDVILPLAQARAMRDALRRRGRYAESLTLAAGSVPWIHGYVSRTALKRLHAAEARLVAPLL